MYLFQDITTTGLHGSGGSGGIDWSNLEHGLEHGEDGLVLNLYPRRPCNHTHLRVTIFVYIIYTLSVRWSLQTNSPLNLRQLTKLYAPALCDPP